MENYFLEIRIHLENKIAVVIISAWIRYSEQKPKDNFGDVIIPVWIYYHTLSKY